ncbi:DUF3800 domain-containing protein [Dehalobacterium formicoaceticum]|uniref:DUF3800 domain-containing protein n=1 Tax=Dehalobacterium formicoaceticum TaxID=51515 RepID=A0ABT1Y7X3_9FIRM|nr:DUF3800 domain-containing protein [Dehalobacterium formicoaceticum]MCR6546990.1 DUF3800 domain-containing protein [Dehalobacterium formicoaceticum]
MLYVTSIQPFKIPKNKMIITLIDTKINIYSNNFYCNLEQEILDELKSCSLLRRKNLSYKFVINSQEKQLTCPMLKFPDKKEVVLWPSIKLPNRKYPVNVYLYGIALYFTSKISMREAALRVCQKFGLAKFGDQIKFWAIIRENYNGKHKELYAETIAELLKHCNVTVNDCVIAVDRVEKVDRYMNRYINNIKEILQMPRLNIGFNDSQKEKGLQIADAIAGSISREYISGDYETSHAVIIIDQICDDVKRIKK